MKIPKGTDIRVDTSNELVELHITAAITTKTQANELAAAIKSFSSVLEGEKRQRKPRGQPSQAQAA
ncbi:hypothetical protein QA640_08905 [Bradyrhizobium sp. CB82]|uniref:hypothetical protein n=1 Tax=Bradyrhizobium sp. CB82 TaxID=3039159 RepID=UPI0024B1A227|nr:hypothetical protein [Bradyrhizobium sp. CB82]WFU42563.1 hypothetical protein QA640_08905 [Bradyrhizobium sp. CB82]